MLPGIDFAAWKSQGGSEAALGIVGVGSLMRLLTQVEGEGCPLPGTGDEGSPLDREVAGADGLGAQAVEEGDFGAWGDADCGERWLG